MDYKRAEEVARVSCRNGVCVIYNVLLYYCMYVLMYICMRMGMFCICIFVCTKVAISSMQAKILCNGHAVQREFEGMDK